MRKFFVIEELEVCGYNSYYCRIRMWIIDLFWKFYVIGWIFLFFVYCMEIVFVKLFVFFNIENFIYIYINKKGVGVLNIEIVIVCFERLF